MLHAIVIIFRHKPTSREVNRFHDWTEAQVLYHQTGSIFHNPQDLTNMRIHAKYCGNQMDDRYMWGFWHVETYVDLWFIDPYGHWIDLI